MLFATVPPILLLSTFNPGTFCGPPTAGRGMTQINASSAHNIVRAIPRMSVLLLQTAMGSCLGSARSSCAGIYIIEPTKLAMFWLRELSKRMGEILTASKNTCISITFPAVRFPRCYSVLPTIFKNSSFVPTRPWIGTCCATSSFSFRMF